MRQRFAWPMVLITDRVPVKAKLLISVTILLAFPVQIYSFYHSFVATDLAWLLLALAAIAASFFPVRIPYAKNKSEALTITASDTFIFAAVLLFSPEVGVTISIIDGILASCRSKRLYRAVFNYSQLSVVTFVSGHLFYWSLNADAPLNANSIEGFPYFLTMLVLWGLLYFLLNSGAVSLVLSLTTQNPFAEIWKQNCRWAWVTHVAGALTAGIILANFQRTQLVAVGIALPLVLVMYYAYQMNHERTTLLQKSKQFLQSTLDSLSSYIAILDESGAIIAVNEGWLHFAGDQHLFGFSYPVGINYVEACENASVNWTRDGFELARVIREVVKGRQEVSFFKYDRGRNGQKQWFAVSVTRFESDGGIRVVVAHENITELRQTKEALKESEEQLRQAQKMEAIGRLAGGVAHDFNNMLTAILGYSDLLNMQLPEYDTRRESVEQIKKAADRAASLTGQLLAFSRKQVLRPRIINLGELVSDTEKMLRRLIGEDVNLVVSSQSDLGQVKADPGQIEQVVMNLAVNARDAMPGGGDLSIKTSNIEVDHSYVDQHLDIKAGPYVLLVVTDDGIGIDEETRSKIFELFFTTKELGKGTGLGLSTVYGIVKQSGGYVTVHSQPGQGTSFRIYLPQVANEFSAVPAIRPDSRQNVLGSETILLVEDEEAVRRLIRKVLEDCGYSVLEASHGEQALDICDRCEGMIHLMITDIVMPSMSGPELAQHVGVLRPDSRILFTSGYAEGALARPKMMVSDDMFLAKPFTSDTLARKVREVLDSSEQVLPAWLSRAPDATDKFPATTI